MHPRASVLSVLLPPVIAKRADEVLQDNGLLLTDRQIQTLRTRLVNAPPGRHHKIDLGLPYGIYKAKNNELFVIFNDDGEQFELVKGGAFGKIKLVQSLDTGEWAILKTMLKTTIIYENLFRREAEMLYKLGQSSSDLLCQRIGKSGPKVDIVMKYHPGQDLFCYQKDRLQCARRYPDLLWLKAVIAVLVAVKEQILDRGYLHADLKIENIIFNLATLIAAVIDLGCARPWTLDEFGRKVAENTGIEGTSYYIAPEILEQEPYSEASDMYAVGVIAMALFKNVATTPPFKSLGSPAIFYNDVASYVEAMKSKDPAQRPSFAAAIQELSKYCVEYEKKHPNEVAALKVLQAVAKKREVFVDVRIPLVAAVDVEQDAKDGSTIAIAKALGDAKQVVGAPHAGDALMALPANQVSAAAAGASVMMAVAAPPLASAAAGAPLPVVAKSFGPS
jgi:hypothetical protein